LREFFGGREGIPWREGVLDGAQLFSMAISSRDPLGGREDFVSTESAVEDCLLPQRMPSSVDVPSVIRVPAFLQVPALLEGPAFLEGQPLRGTRPRGSSVL
jgi:hypothetical protein